MCGAGGGRVWGLGTRLALKGEVHLHLEVRGKELNLWVWGWASEGFLPDGLNSLEVGGKAMC